jgi:membrane protease YdiL (CAAX protease family)
MGAAGQWCALIFAMCFPALMAWVYFVALAQPVGEAAAPVSGALAACVAKCVQFSFPILWLCSVERRRLRLAAPRFNGLVLALGFGLLVAAFLLYVYHRRLIGSDILATLVDRIREKLVVFHADTPGRYVLLAVFIAVIHSLLEEYYWRWFVFGELRRRVSVQSAIALSALAFMAHHVIVLGFFLPQHFFTAAVPFSLCVGLGGVAWAWLYERTGTIYSVWISHVVVDAAILVVGYDMVFTRDCCQLSGEKTEGSEFGYRPFYFVLLS